MLENYAIWLVAAVIILAMIDLYRISHPKPRVLEDDRVVRIKPLLTDPTAYDASLIENAIGCPYLRLSERYGKVSQLNWHCLYCVHPGMRTPWNSSTEVCYLAWRGRCPFGWPDELRISKEAL